MIVRQCPFNLNPVLAQNIIFLALLQNQDNLKLTKYHN